jgi:hypothetical protein
MERSQDVGCLYMGFYLTDISTAYEFLKVVICKTVSKYFHLTKDFFWLVVTLQNRQRVTKYLVPKLKSRVCYFRVQSVKNRIYRSVTIVH